MRTKGTGGQAVSFYEDGEQSPVPERRRPILEHGNFVGVIEYPGQIGKSAFGILLSQIEEEREEEEFLVIGVDTEYVTPKKVMTNKEVRQGDARYEVLSYQFFCRNHAGEEWSGIALTENGKRMSFSEFVVFALGKGLAEGAIEKVPRSLIVVGHYNRADIPAFDDRDDLIKQLNNLRKSIVSYDMAIKLRINGLGIDDPDSDRNVFHIKIRDSILLAPADKKSLEKLGSLVGAEKVRLSDCPKEEKRLKENMDLLLTEQWDLFRRYAIADAEICVRYFLKIVDLYEGLTGTRNIPSALSSMGIKLLLKRWSESDPPLDRFQAVGKEVSVEPSWDGAKQRFVTKKRTVYFEEIHWFSDFATECYHGGRNETFAFGPSQIDRWSDLDLTSAYPTAMSLIEQPDWRNIRPTTSLDDFTLGKFSFACVDFRFPDDVRYPCLPVRSANGVIFPLSGRSYCSSPEIVAALALGCDVKLRHGVVIPTVPGKRIFFPFIRQCIDNRRSAASDIENAFWKELTNSSYGKTAQGLRNRRVFNLQEKGTRRLPPSDLTNPFYASYITSLVRATVGEIINAIPRHKIVFSVTTDGFITNASEKEIGEAQSGPLCRMFSRACLELRDDPTVLSEKHSVRRVLGWRTRGQATLIKGDKDDVPPLILAKAGIQTPVYYDRTDEQNDYIVKLFFRRDADTEIEFDVLTSMRDMVLFNADLVPKRITRRVSMEYDFKRCPVDARMVEGSYDAIDGPSEFRHIAFDTKPWASIEQFRAVREIWTSYDSDRRRCIKDLESYREFAAYCDTKNALAVDGQKYLSKKGDADLKRLKRDLCRAFKHGKAGLGPYASLTANQFIGILSENGFGKYGIPCVRRDVETGKQREFEPNTTPGTRRVIEVLELLKGPFPTLDPSEIVYGSSEVSELMAALGE